MPKYRKLNKKTEKRKWKMRKTAQKLNNAILNTRVHRISHSSQRSTVNNAISLKMTPHTQQPSKDWMWSFHSEKKNQPTIIQSHSQCTFPSLLIIKRAGARRSDESVRHKMKWIDGISVFITKALNKKNVSKIALYVKDETWHQNTSRVAPYAMSFHSSVMNEAHNKIHNKKKL